MEMDEKNTNLYLPNRLSEILKGIADWMSTPDLVPETKISWTESQLSALLEYVLKVEVINSDFCQQSPAYSCLNKVWACRFKPQYYEKFVTKVAIFMLQLQVLFQVPRLHPYSYDITELVAAFITFLLELLDYETEFIVSFYDQICCLEKELRFLVAILGDTPFQGADDYELEGINRLLAEFEAVANEAGRLVCSFIFTSQELFKCRGTDKDLSVLLEHIGLLKANIVILLDSLPFITNENMKPRTCAVESIFIVDSLLCDLEDLTNSEDDRIFDVKDQIKVLRQGLTLSQSLLKDIKLPWHLEIEELKELAMGTRDVAYEAEYLINIFLIRDAPIWYPTIRLPQVIHKIEPIKTGLQEIKKNYESGALQVAKDFGEQLSLQRKRSPDIVDEIVVGLDEAAINILDQLVGGTEHLQIISIIGMPGIGKTTLAKKLYNHSSVNYRFDKCSWCVASQTYQRKSLLIDILVGLDPKLGILDMEEGSLAERIHKILKGRRYLIVMDDIWDLKVWDDFHRYFPDDENGSRVLLTSRDKDVAPPHSIIYALPPLSNHQCWELLERKVFQNEPCPPQLLEIGKEIAAKCNGLPLAVVVIAGILSTMNKEISTWRNVERSLALYILSDKDNDVMQILKISYKHLPEHLKPCFLYFGAFPENEIMVKKLKWLWIAEGFIRKEESKSMESVAEEYLVELINKNLLIVARTRSNGEAKACVVHDLLRELCLIMAEEENFSKVIQSGFEMYEKHQRLFVCMDHSFHGFHVRSFFCRDQDISFCFQNMKLLRVLDLPKYSLNDGGGIEFLVHLRYLTVQSMRLESIGHLVNLEVLIVRFEKIHFPMVIEKMVKLRYLNARTAVLEQGDYWNSSRTNNLEFLSFIDVKTPEDEEMLKCSPHLRKLKCECVPFVDKQGAYRYPDIRFLTELESLSMWARLVVVGTIPVEADMNLPSNIKKLTLSSLGLPWEKMSIIGELPNLQVLKLGSEAFVGEVWDTADGEFQQLKFLKLDNFKEITCWNVTSSEHFPKLQRLVLHHCFKLQEIPCEIGEIDTLQSIEVNWCLEAVAESARKIQQEQQENGIEDLTVIVGDIHNAESLSDDDSSTSSSFASD